MHKSKPKQTKLCITVAVASGGCEHISAAPLSSFIPLWCLWWWAWSCPCSATDLLRFVWNANMNYLLLLFWFCFSHRAKPAASSNSNSNSNDAGGVDEPDLEKMKQVFYFLRLRIKKNGYCNFLLASVTGQEYCFYHFLHQWSATSIARINFITVLDTFLNFLTAFLRLPAVLRQCRINLVNTGEYCPLLYNTI